MKGIVFIISIVLCYFSTAAKNPIYKQVTVSGQVLCSQSKKPVQSHITIQIDQPEAVRLSSLPDGKFVAILPAVQSFKLRAEATGYDPIEQVYELMSATEDTTFFVEVFLDPTFQLEFSGTVVDSKTHLPIPAELDLYLNSDIIKEDIQVIHDGRYKEVLSKEGWYIIELKSSGYVSLTDTLWFMNEKRSLIHKDYQLTPLEVGYNMVIDNLTFYFGKTELKPESATTLESIVELLKANPSISVEIAGHTDDEGDADYNQLLSQGRAQAVVDHLVKQGIEANRLMAKGYGESKPIDLGKTKAGKARNRRVEFTVVNVNSIN